MKINADDRDSGQGLRLHVLNVVDGGGHAALAARRHHVSHLVGVQAVVLPNDADNRNINRRKNVSRHARNGQASRQKER